MWRVIQVSNLKNANLILFGCGDVLWAIRRARNDWCFGGKTLCWGPSAPEGPQKHDLTMFLEYNT
jgi:hypothetical protein